MPGRNLSLKRAGFYCEHFSFAKAVFTFATKTVRLCYFKYKFGLEVTLVLTARYLIA